MQNEVDNEDIMTVKEFKDNVGYGVFTDYDGVGRALINGIEMDPTVCIRPSNLGQIPSEATHIAWYNK